MKEDHFKEASGTWRVVGTMSGTSLDGLDICISDFRLQNGQWSVEVLAAKTYPYSSELVKQLAEAHMLPNAELDQLDETLSAHIGQRVRQFIEETGIRNIDLLGSHGHTVHHLPHMGVTVQIGNRPSLRKEAQMPTVCDFRPQDVRLGGQGAPLVPIGDQLLFSQYDACVNLGGFANLSLERNGQRIAWDICPVNMGLNRMANRVGLPFDENGRIAQSGTVNTALLSRWNNIAFYKTPPPKSLGREWFDTHIQPDLEHLSTEDALATLTEHAAQQLAQTLNHHHVEQALLTGGGAYNSLLIERVKHLSKSEIIAPNPLIVNFKEALVFGFLAILKVRGEINVLAAVTGASHDHSSGVVYP